ncbi:MAG: hypothetical protein ABJJ43_06600, partial [Ekhidna sp.]
MKNLINQQILYALFLLSIAFACTEDEPGSTNNSPTLSESLGNLSLATGFETFDISLSDVFTDEDGDNITLTVESSDEEVALAEINGQTLTLIEVGNGSTTISVTASDPSEASISDVFTVEISETISATDIFTFSNQDGNSLTIDSWTAVDGADGYAIVINTEDSFTDLTNGENDPASTSYNGVGEQLIYNGTSISPLNITILELEKSYYFKLVPYTGSHVYDNQLDSEEGTTTTCSYSSTSISQVCFSISGDIRTISSNQYPSHAVGSFPNADPTAIESTHGIDLTPEKAGSITYVYDETGGPTPSNDKFYQFGVAVNGIEFHPMGLKPWENPDTGEENWEWQAKVTEEDDTGLDA